jgi:hypothetical protein
VTVVVDASIVVAGLAGAGATGEWAESVLAGEPLAAPHLMPAEAASILHRAELAGEISPMPRRWRTPWRSPRASWSGAPARPARPGNPASPGNRWPGRTPLRPGSAS